MRQINEDLNVVQNLQIKNESNHMTMRHGCRSFVRGTRTCPLTNKGGFVTFAPTKVRYIFSLAKYPHPNILQMGEGAFNKILNIMYKYAKKDILLLNL